MPVTTQRRQVEADGWWVWLFFSVTGVAHSVSSIVNFFIELVRNGSGRWTRCYAETPTNPLSADFHIARGVLAEHKSDALEGPTSFKELCEAHCA